MTNNLEPQTLGLLDVLKQLTKHFEPRPISTVPVPDEPHISDGEKQAREGTNKPHYSGVSGQVPRTNSRGSGNSLSGGDSIAGNRDALSDGVNHPARQGSMSEVGSGTDYPIRNGEQTSLRSHESRHNVTGLAAQTLRAPSASELQDGRECGLPLDDVQAMLAELPKQPPWWMEEQDTGLPFA